MKVLLLSTTIALFLLLTTVPVAEADCKNVYFYFIGSNMSDFKNMSSTSNFNSLSATYFQKTLTTVFYTGGWLLNFSSFDVETVFSAYMTTRRSSVNLVYVDWSYYSNDLYFVPMVSNIDCVSIEGVSLWVSI
jgi:hypothetical protein